MAALSGLVRALSDVGVEDVALVGGKAARLGQLLQAGFPVPHGFVLTTAAYELFLSEAQLQYVIGMELGRKAISSMRWEELWDAALRIRSAFAQAQLPGEIEQSVLSAPLPPGNVAVRSSAPAEDGVRQSFAGLHASLLGQRGPEQVLRAVREVWASLWSDAALLYRRELGLDPLVSRMAVVIQVQIETPCSGVAFGLDPRAPHADRVVIEAVPGSCEGLVDGSLDPDHYVLERSTGRLLERRRGGDAPDEPLLGPADLARLHRLLNEVRDVCGWTADLEWTGRGDGLTLLQARPASAAEPGSPKDDRRVYFSYCPGPRQLATLSRRVAEELIPQLQTEGDRLAALAVEALGDTELAETLEARFDVLEHWRSIYQEAFIPFAHGVRVLGLFYNDAVQPVDPHEFVGLLKGESFLAKERNDVLQALGNLLHERTELRADIAAQLAPTRECWTRVLELLERSGASELAKRLAGLLNGALDVVFGGVRLVNRPELVLRPLVAEGADPVAAAQEPDLALRAALEARLLDAVGPRRTAEAQNVLGVARLAWRLRDDDNLLLGRIESQLQRAVEEGGRRLQNTGRLEGRSPGVDDARSVAAALRSARALVLAPAAVAHGHAPRARPRQLVGQPASPGIAEGLVRCVKTAGDLAEFLPGEVLVCDAIQPQMTHLVPLAKAVIERRGGMLIHGAIIARELGIPCVNGVQAATDFLRNGLLVTVDGDLGLVTVGTADLPTSVDGRLSA